MPFKKIITRILLFFLSLSIVLLVLFINIPDILESQIKTRIKTHLKNGIGKKATKFLDADVIEFNIQNFGFFNTNISNIKICDSISIDSINIDYDIKNLSSINIERVTISGLNIHAAIDDNNQIKIKGLDFPETSKKSSPKKDLTFLQYLPGKVVIENSKIILHFQYEQLENDFLIPFDMVSSIRKHKGNIDAKIKLYPFGETINGQVSYDINKGIKSVLIQTSSFDIAHLNRFISQKSDKIDLKGLLDFKLESDSPQNRWKMNISRIDLIQPLKASIEDIKVKLLINNRKINATGSIDLSIPSLQTISFKYAAAIDLQNNNHLDLKVATTKIDTLKLLYQSNIVMVNQPSLSAGFQGVSENIKGTIILNSDKINIKNKKADIAVTDLKIVSNIAAQSGNNENRLTSKFTVDINNISMYSDFLDSTLPKTNISGEFFLNKENFPFLSMNIKINDANIISSKFKTKVSGIKIELPVFYPDPIKKENGKFSISSILYDKKYDFSTKGQILQIASKKDKNIFNAQFKIGGDVGFGLLPHIKTQFDSIIGFDERGPGASFKVKTNSFTFNKSDLEKLLSSHPVSQDFNFNVLVNTKADYTYNNFKTEMSLALSDGKIVMSDNNLIVEGINTNIKFNDLLSFTTVPGQVVTIDSVKKKNIKIKNAKIRFTLEKEKSLLIENVQFNWCDGLVSTESIRFPQANSEYSLSLYCDRLEMKQLLKQVGDFNAQGSGTLNGRIPVVYSNGNISFEKGFLFSTPGKGGKILIANSNKIISGIPMDSPQFAQLDLAQEALKDFKYKWAKLKFHTKEEILFVNMELDGEPSKVLPFEYSKEFGGFARVDASNPGSHFQGIKLDINLQLPFNEVLKSGNKLKSIFN